MQKLLDFLEILAFQLPTDNLLAPIARLRIAVWRRISICFRSNSPAGPMLRSGSWMSWTETLVYSPRRCDVRRWDINLKRTICRAKGRSSAGSST